MKALVLAGVLRRGVVSPVVLGHEVAGQVEAVGSGVASVAPGDPVTAALRKGSALLRSELFLGCPWAWGRQKVILFDYAPSGGSWTLRRYT